MINKNLNGNCPYCSSQVEFESIRRPGQHVVKCNSCQKFAVKLLKNNVVYPVATPTDSTSLPSIVTK
jgi:endogenous inhibitor of DNA gyrase (YacG/DUF329 family)